jgi:Mitochondrial carrier protein.
MNNRILSLVATLFTLNCSRALIVTKIQYAPIPTRGRVKPFTKINVNRHNARLRLLYMKEVNEDCLESGSIGSRRSFLTKSLSSVLAVSAVTACPAQYSKAFAKTKVVQNQLATPLISASSAKVPGDRTFQESVSGFVSGAALTVTKTFVKYPLDTATVRLQMPNSKYSIMRPAELLDGSYRGIVLPLLSNIPGGGVFFAIKDATKSICKDAGMPKWMATSIAVGVANFPYWLIRNPSEVIKTRQQANIEGYVTVSGDGGDGKTVSALDAIKFALNSTESDAGAGGLAGFYSGYWENIIYAYPADLLKFLSYEALSGGRKNLSPLEGAAYGATATAIAQYFTTPLDVVRNRIMAGKDASDENEANNDYLSRMIRIGKEEGVGGLFAGASPRVGKAFLSGAIQFATYEETKQSIGALFQANKKE